VIYEWAINWIHHQEAYPLRDVRHVAIRSAATPSDADIRTHHLFLATVKEGRLVRVELKEIVYHEEAVQWGQYVSQILGKPFVDESTG
jgi:hypothetical protein